MSKRYPEVGSISHGTLLLEDLIPEGMYTLERFAPKAARRIRREYSDVFAVLDTFGEWDRFGEETQEAAGWAWEAICDRLDDCAAPYMYFGATEGDFSDFGFWPCLDSLQEDVRSGEVIDWQKTKEAHCYRAGTLAVDINDHGNVSLLEVRYHNGKREWRNVWGIV
jgi:hypothetical protein